MSAVSILARLAMLVLIAAQSLDGFIARHDRPGTDFCSEADARFLRESLRDFDSLIMGRKTYDTLRDRIQNSPTKKFLRKILTRHPEDYEADFKPELVEFASATPSALLSELATRGRSRTALLGGSQIYSQFLAETHVDELWITVEPILLGKGIPLATNLPEQRLRLRSSRKLDENVLLLKYTTG